MKHYSSRFSGFWEHVPSQQQRLALRQVASHEQPPFFLKVCHTFLPMNANAARMQMLTKINWIFIIFLWEIKILT